MKLFKITRRDDFTQDYDTYDSAVVAAPCEEFAIGMHPDGRTCDLADFPSTWDVPPEIEATFIGEACDEIDTPRVICASFNSCG